jgi:MobC-like protein
MEQNQAVRNKWLNIRMSEAEYQEAEKRRLQTTCRSLSEYARKAVLGKPVIMRYHNDSLDEFITHMLVLRKELNSIGANFNQAVKRLHSLNDLPGIQQWILINEQEKTQIFRQISTISDTINKAYESWKHK